MVGGKLIEKQLNTTSTVLRPFFCQKGDIELAVVIVSIDMDVLVKPEDVMDRSNLCSDGLLVMFDPHMAFEL